VPSQCGCLGRHPVARQVDHAAMRNPGRKLELSESDREDLLRSTQRLLKTPARGDRRPLAPPFQVRDPRPGRHLQQHLQDRPLPGREQLVQRVIQPLGRLVPHPGDQPGDCRDAGQQHGVVPKPSHRGGEDGLRPLPGVPRAGIDPLREVLLRLAEVLQGVGVLDLPPRPARTLRNLRTGQAGTPKLGHTPKQANEAHLTSKNSQPASRSSETPASPDPPVASPEPRNRH
jgi:hypothetical protein